MNFKNMIKSAKKLAEDTIKDAKDPKKQKERDLKRAEAAIELAQKSVAAYQTAGEMVDKAKTKAAEKIKDVEPVAEIVEMQAKEAFKTGRKQLGSLVDKWQNRNKTDKTTDEPKASKEQNNKPPKNPKP